MTVGGPERRLEGRAASQLLNEASVKRLRAEIAANAGGEVFAVGFRDPLGGLVDGLEILSRGNERMAPALIAQASRGDVAIHNHPSGDLRPSDADVEVASVLARGATGFFIVDNAVERVHVVVPIPEPAAESPVRPEEVEDFLKREIAEKLPDYESRPGQVAMARSIAEVLSGRRLLLVEAGTGTGKTFAYLLPAVLWAIRNDRPVVVSTGTITLQEQIIDKDIPFLQSGILPPFRAVLVKGRGNFVSLRRAREAALLPPQAFDSAAEAAEVAELTQWASATKSGDIAELSPRPSPGAWERVESQADNCLGARCPSYRDCHYYKMRSRARGAQILVVNHHLLLADLSAKAASGSFAVAAVLPPFDRLVIDEAHHFEDIAADYLASIFASWA
jgi:ATP-dependent DNA helicase DinG